MIQVDCLKNIVVKGSNICYWKSEEKKFSFITRERDNGVVLHTGAVIGNTAALVNCDAIKLHRKEIHKGDSVLVNVRGAFFVGEVMAITASRIIRIHHAKNVFNGADYGKYLSCKEDNIVKVKDGKKHIIKILREQS